MMPYPYPTCQNIMVNSFAFTFIVLLLSIVFNKSSTTYSARIPLAPGEYREEPDFQDDQPPTSISDQHLSLLAAHKASLHSADHRNIHLRMIQNLPLLHDIAF